MAEESIYEGMSKAETKVGKYLDELGILWEYQRPIFIWDEQDRPRVWTPDIFLFQYGIYVEVCGSKDFNYEYRHKIMKNNGYLVIFLHLYKAEKDWKKHFLELFFSLNDYRQEEIKKIQENLKNKSK